MNTLKIPAFNKMSMPEQKEVMQAVFDHLNISINDWSNISEYVNQFYVEHGKREDDTLLIDVVREFVKSNPASFKKNETNIVKKVCKELGITQKELAEMLDVLPSAVSNWANGQIPKMAQLALELLLENKSLKSDMEILKKAHQILHR